MNKQQKNKISIMKKYARSYYFENISRLIEMYSKRFSAKYACCMR